MAGKVTTNGVEIPLVDGKYSVRYETEGGADEVCPPVHLEVVGGQLSVYRSTLSSAGKVWFHVFGTKGGPQLGVYRAGPPGMWDATKPGWKTTEWWYGIIATLFSALVAGGVILQSQADALVAGLHGLVSVIFSIAAFGFAKHYMTQRTIAKREAQLGRKVTTSDASLYG